MENSFRKVSGCSLCIGSLLSVVTMALHPSGGNMEHIIKTRQVLMLSHSLAIACLPFMAFGSLGLSFILQTKNRISWLALFIFCFGLIAAMVAAVINGLVLPQFIAHSVVESCNESVVKAITVYGHYFNVSMASIFIFATTASVAIWSALIIRSAHFPKWPGYLGLLLFAFEMVCLCSNLNFTDLYGFRIFVTGLAGWQIFAGICMWRARWEK